MMASISGHGRLRYGGLALVSFVLFVTSAAGQAWVPEKGEGTLSTSFDCINFEGHFNDDWSRTPEAASKSRSFLFDFEYGLTDRFAITVSLPIVSARYASNNPSSDDLLVLFNQAVQT